MTTSVRRITLALVLTLLAAGSLSAAWKWREVRLYRRAMAEIQDEIKNAHFGLAARHLGSLLAMKPAWDEAIYLLGVCEKERGQIDQASVTWGGVPPDSAFFRQAAQGRIELLIQAGRFADAEQLVKDMLADRRGGDSDLGLFLGPVYSQEGRLDEAMRSIEDWWKRLNERGEGASEKAINLVRLHIELEDKLPPVDAIRAFLDDSASRSPTDDRLFLGRANLAIRTARWMRPRRFWMPASGGDRTMFPSGAPAALGRGLGARRRGSAPHSVICRPPYRLPPKFNGWPPGLPASAATSRPSNGHSPHFARMPPPMSPPWTG